MRICPDCLERFDDAVLRCTQDAAETLALEQTKTADPRIGTLMLDRFLVLGVLGAGGMGMVYKAFQRSTARKVALKLLIPDLAQREDAGLLKRFEREARVTAGLSSPHTVTVYDFGQLPSGELFIAMEMLNGRPLDAVLKSDGGLAPHRVARIIQHVCLSLQEAHDKGLVHRDLKPGNIFLDQLPNGDDFAKVLDFGVAKVMDESQGQLTKTGATVGTPAYMSPEQALAEPVGPGTDVYATGVIMFQMLTGKLPFDDMNAETQENLSAMQLMMKHIMEPPRSMASLGLTQPPYDAFDRVIDTCLQKKTEDRYRSAAQLHDALGQLGVGGAGVAGAGRKGAGAALAMADASTRPATAGVSRPATGPGGAAAPPRKRTPAWVFAGIAALVVGLGVTAAVVMGQGDAPEAARVAAAKAAPLESPKAPPAREGDEPGGGGGVDLDDDPAGAAGDPKAADAGAQAADGQAPSPDAGPSAGDPGAGDAGAGAPAVDAGAQAAGQVADAGTNAAAPAPGAVAGGDGPPAGAGDVTAAVTAPKAVKVASAVKAASSKPASTAKATGKATAEAADDGGSVKVSTSIIGTAMSKGDARAPLAKIKSKAKTCYRKAVKGADGPTLKVNLLVFPSGAVKKASVTGGGPASAVEACLKGTALAAKFPSFTGAAFTAIKLTIRP